MHKLVHVAGTVGGRPGRSTGAEMSALYLFGSTGTVDRVCPTVIFLTVGGRPGRSTASLSGCHISLTASFWFGLYKPQLFGILTKVFTREKFPVFQSLKQVFKRVFWALNFSSLLFWVFGKSKRTRFWDIVLDFHFYHLQEISQVVFLCCLFPKIPSFPHLSYLLS